MGLPANSVCRFSPDEITVGSAPTTVTVQIYTDLSSTLASNEGPRGGSGILAALGLPLGLGLVLLRRRKGLRAAGIPMLAIVFAAAVSGCSNNVTPTFSKLVTPAGSSPLTITFTGSNGLTQTHSVSVALTIIPDSGPY
jgi:hypothetical protein